MPRQESDWSAAIGTWKIGRRDDALSLLSGVRRTTTNSDTRLVGNYDPVTGKHSVAHFSVGKAGWRNHRKKPAPEWMMHAHSHPRAITAPRQAQLGERKVALRENAATPGSPVVFFGDAMPMEGRTVLATPTSVKTSPPHPARKYAETMRRLTPKENLPRRVGLQQSAAREQRELGGQVPILNAGDVRKLLQRLVVSSLETAMMQLENALSSEPAQGVSPADLERMLFTAHWKCEDDQMLALRRVYACNAGVDADLVVRDMKECISRPGFGAARYPAAMQIIVASLQHRMQILEARFIKSDVEVRENNKCVGARERGEEPANHVDVEVFGQHLKCCGFPADSIVMAQMQRLYCCVEGLWMGLLDYQRFLVDLRKAASSFFAAATDASQWAYNLPSDVKPEKRDVAAWMEGAAGRLRPETSAEEEDHRSFEPDVQVDGVKRVEFWTRPSTAESDIRRCNLRSGIRGQDELSRARPCSSRPATSDSGKQDILNMTSTSSESLLASMFFGNSSAILRQGSKYEEQLRKRMALIFHKLDDVHRCFRDLDMRRSRSVPELAAEDVLRPYARNLLLKDITWLMTRFSPDGRFRYEEFIEWCSPPVASQEPPQLQGQVPTSANYTVSMRGGLVQRAQAKDEGTMAFQPTASRHQLRMPPPPRKIFTPAEWAGSMVAARGTE